MEEKVKGNRRRRERAKKMRNEIVNVKASEDSCEEMPIVRAKPPRPRKRNKGPLFEEDIIDGFAVMAFRSFEDLERCVRTAEKENSRVLEPYPNRIKCESLQKRSSLPKVKTKVEEGSRFSTEEGYVCDRESEGDKLSDVDDSSFYTTCNDAPDKISALSRSNTLVENEHLSIDASLPSKNLPTTLRSENVSIVRTDSYTSARTTVAMSNIAPSTDFPKITIKEEPFHYQNPNPFVQKSVETKPDLSSCGVYEDKKPLYSEQKYSPIDQKPIIDTKPPLFSAINICPPSTYNSLFHPHFNTITTANSALITSSVTTTTTTTTSSAICSVPQLAVNHTTQNPIPSQSVISNKGKFSVSSLVSGTNSTNSDYVSNHGPSIDRGEQPSIVRPQTVKSYPTKSPIHLPVSKLHLPTPQNIGKSQLPQKSPICFGESNGSFPSISSYGLPSPLVPTSSHYPVFAHSKAPTIASYPSPHDSVKMEPGEYNVKVSPKLSLKPTPPHMFGHTSVSHPSTFGALPNIPNHSPHLKGDPSFSVVGKREPTNGTPPRPTTPHSGFPLRYSHRTQDPHANLYNSPSNLGCIRLSNYPRTAAPGSFPLSTPISAPLPPSGMFAPHPSGQPIAAAPVLPSGNSLGQDPLGANSAQADLLRRELDSRFLATQDRSAVGMAPSGLGTMGTVPTLLRTDVHHHQHQHTHVHQHLLPQLQPPLQPPPLAPSAPSGIFSHSAATPSLFKEVNKVGMESGLYHQRSGLGSFSSGLSPLIPSNNSTPLVTSQMTPVSKKSGRWNVMHVRIAWEIFYDQQKQAAAKGIKLGPSDILRNDPGIPGTPSLFSNLSRPNDHLGSMLSSSGSAHRMENSYLGVPHITPSVPGFRYATAAPSHNSTFPSTNITPTNIPGPPPGSMFSREAAQSAVSMPAPLLDPWRIRAPVAFGNANTPTWHHKADSAYFENERREQEERDRRNRQEKERKEREEQQRRKEQERREREEKEKREREERERRERDEKQREREKRAEHEKERLARIDSYNERGTRRDESRSPLRMDSKECHLAGVIGQHMKHDSRSSSGSKYDSSRDEITIVGSKEGNRLPHPPTNILGPPVLPSASSSFLGAHPLSSTSALERARLLGSGYHVPHGNPPLGHWPDPYRAGLVSAHDPFATARADYAARESFLSARDHLRDPLRDSLDRAREEHLMRVNPLGTMILNERYREHQAAREMIERERHYAAAAAAAGSVPGGLYSHPAMLPPHSTSSASLLPQTLKTASPLGHPHMVPHPSLHPQHLGLYPPTHLGHHSLAPGLPPPLIPSLAGPGQGLSRPPDKKDLPK